MDKVVYNEELKVWVDSRLNTWATPKTQDEALAASSSLKGCTRCHQCFDCIDCHSCSDCEDCIVCNSCVNCTHGERLSMCTACNDCIQCYHCLSCGNCNGSVHCRDCSFLTPNPDVTNTEVSYSFISVEGASGHPVLYAILPSMTITLDSQGTFHLDKIKGKGARPFSGKYESVMRACHKALLDVDGLRIADLRTDMQLKA